MIAVILMQLLEHGHKPEVNNNPRIVRVSGSLLQQPLRRFRLNASENEQVAEEQSNKHLDLLTISSEEQESRSSIRSASCESRQQGGTALTPTTKPSPRSLNHHSNKNTSDVAVAIGEKQSTTRPRHKRGYLLVNGVSYMRVDLLGKGGSSRVYRVVDGRDIIFALKRVDVKDVDETTLRGYQSEIDLLKRLAGVRRVVNLLDWELDHQKGILSLVMEFGDLDFESILKSEINKPNACLNLTYVRFYWKEMLECIAAVHDFDIVHSDLKPANFVMVDGRLKIIDFGIANLIGDDTVNVHREQLVGTPNYMAPESLLDVGQSKQSCVGESHKLIKVGKASDIWSLGCILYQMTYGKAPFAHISNHMHRAMAIINPGYIIEYPPLGFGGAKIPLSLSRTMRECLSWDYKLRPTTQVLLSPSNPFLYVDSLQSHTSDEAPSVDVSEVQLGSVLRNVARFCETTSSMPTATELEDWSKIFLEKLQNLN